MPLLRGKSKRVRSANIAELQHPSPNAPEGRSPQQAAAIEYSREREKEGLKDRGGKRKR